MALSNKTIQNLAIALTPEVINYIYADESWIDYMMEVVPEAVAAQLKTEDYELVNELSTAVLENIVMRAITVPMSKGVSVK
jgi:formamidopyrimidine-DNA glycosylase